MKKDNETIIEQLKELGFSEYKAKVFLTLSSGKIMSASEIVNEAKIVRGSIYDILKSFVQSGYCNEIETNRILQYQIIDPDVILDKIIKEHEKKHNDTVLTLKNTFKEVKANYDIRRNGESKLINVEIIRGFNKHRIAKYRELLLSAKKEICGMYKLRGIVSDEADTLAKNFIKRGGKIFSIYQLGIDFKIQKGDEITEGNPADLIKVCRKFEEAGEQIRLAEKEIPNMTVIDGENVFINSEDKWIPKQSQADIIFKRSNFAKYMKDLFDFYWNESMTIDEYEKKLKKQIKE